MFACLVVVFLFVCAFISLFDYLTVCLGLLSDPKRVSYSPTFQNYFVIPASVSVYTYHYIQQAKAAQEAGGSGLLPICEHPITSSIKSYDVCVRTAFRTVMQSLADLLPRLPPGSDIQKVQVISYHGN